MRIKIQWFNGDGNRAGSEISTLAELDNRLRLAGATMTFDNDPVSGKAFRGYRIATGETARVFAVKVSQATR